MSIRARFLDPDGRLGLGLVQGDRIALARGDILGALTPTETSWARDEVRMLSPVVPSKVVAVARNYVEHAKELGNDVPGEPRIFLKPSTSVVGPQDAIEIPPGTQRVDHEAELAVVVGRAITWREVARWASEADALAHVAGYTALNDVTARDFQRADGQFTRGKGFDTFCPLGPVLVTDLDTASLSVRCLVDGQVRQDGTTADMVFDVVALLRYIGGVMTLFPGDVIATGTPAGVGPVTPGQRCTVEIEGIGTLENPVVARGDRPQGGSA